MAVLLYRMRPPNFITDNLISHRDRGFGFGCWRATMDLGNRRLLLLWGFDDSTKSSERRFLVADSIASSIARRSSSANPCSPSHSSCSPIFTFYVWRVINNLAFNFFSFFFYWIFLPEELRLHLVECKMIYMISECKIFSNVWLHYENAIFSHFLSHFLSFQTNFIIENFNI